MPSRSRREQGVSTARVVAKGTKRKVMDSDDEFAAVTKPKREKKVAHNSMRKAEMGQDEETPTEASSDVALRTNLNRSMMDIPVELIYEIASYLDPGDLSSLCDVSVWLWRILHSSNQATLSLWTTSREREGVYKVGRGMNEYQWARLFFGSRCMECGIDKVRNAAAVDFHIRRRLCNPCKKAKYMEHGDLNYQEIADALALCPFTRLKWDGTTTSCYKFSWSDDVLVQKTKLDALHADVQRGKEASTELTDYVSSMKAIVRGIEEEVGHLTQLYKAYRSRLKEENSERFKPRYEQIESKFIEMGYQVGDFPPNLKMHRLVRQQAKLNERAWQSIREALEPAMQANRTEREFKEWIRLKVRRRQLVDELYAEYKFNHVRLTEWQFMPQVRHICMKPDVAAIVEADRNRTVTLADFAPCFEGLGEYLASAFEQTKVRLRKRVLAANDAFFTSDLTKTQAFKDLELAAIVFRCTACNRGIFGWDDVRSHCCDEPDEKFGLHVQRDEETRELIDPMTTQDSEFPHTYKYWELGSLAVRLVMESLCMDPKTTTTAQMDADPNLRLECWCSGQSRRHCAHKWRMLAWHLTRSYHENDLSDGQRKLMRGKVPEACVPGIIQHEFESIVSRQYGFLCGHCVAHLRAVKQTGHRHLGSHLSEKHAIDDPRVNVDFVIMKNALTEYHYFYDGTYFDYEDQYSGLAS